MSCKTHQTPCAASTVQVDDSAEVIVKGDVDIQATSDPASHQKCRGHKFKHANLQSSSLEQVFVVLLPGLLCLLSGQAGTRLGEAAVLINKSKLLDNVVVESAFPLSVLQIHVSVLQIKYLFNITKSTQHMAGNACRRGSEKLSGLSFPSLKVRIIFWSSWLSPYRIERSKYEEV
jgi:hypothetical protein